jgi:hypothetical protein
MAGLLKWALLAVVGLVGGTWVAAWVMLPPPHTEPRYAGVVLSAASDRLLRASCFDCHSNETHLQWFDYLPGALQVVTWDLIVGRKELNFSQWDSLIDTRRARKLKSMGKQIESGGMPPWYYTPLHSEAQLSPQGKKQLLDDLAKAGAASPAVGKDERREPEGKRGEREERKKH